MPDANKSARNNMDEKSANELDGFKRHRFGLVAISVVPECEGDSTILQRHDATVGNGHAVGVAGQILERLFGSSKRRLGVNDPLLLTDSLAKCFKSRRSCQGLQLAVEPKLAFPKRLLQVE